MIKTPASSPPESDTEKNPIAEYEQREITDTSDSQKPQLGYWWVPLALLPLPKRSLKDRMKLVKQDPKTGVQIEMISTDAVLPYGIYSRKILLWLLTTIKKQIPTIKAGEPIPRSKLKIILPASPTELYRMVTGDKSASEKSHRQQQQFREQLRRILTLMFSVKYSHKQKGLDIEKLQRINVVTEFSYRVLDENYKGRPGLILKFVDENNENYLMLSQEFIYATIELRKLYPVDIAAVRNLTVSEFDLYCLLSYRLASVNLTKNQVLRLLTWQSLDEIFYDSPSKDKNQRASRKILFKNTAPKSLISLQKKGLLATCTLEFTKEGVRLNGDPDINPATKKSFHR